MLSSMKWPQSLSNSLAADRGGGHSNSSLVTWAQGIRTGLMLSGIQPPRCKVIQLLHRGRVVKIAPQRSRQNPNISITPPNLHRCDIMKEPLRSTFPTTPAHVCPSPSL